MATLAGVGLSRKEPSGAAAREAVAQALGAVGRADLVLLYATPDHNPKLLMVGAAQVAGDAAIAGCAAEHVGGVEAPAVGAIVVRSDRLTFSVHLGPGISGVLEGRGAPAVVLCHWSPGAAAGALLDAGLPLVIGGPAASFLLAKPPGPLPPFGHGQIARDGVVTIAIRGGQPRLVGEPLDGRRPLWGLGFGALSRPVGPDVPWLAVGLAGTPAGCVLVE